MKFFKVPFGSDDSTFSAGDNRLQQYIQSQSMKDMAQMASEIDPDVKQMIGANVQALLGYLPAGEFNTTIMSSKESLQNLLASAMLTGYFLHAMEQRMLLDDVFDGRPPEKKRPPKKKAETLELSPPEELFKKIREKVMRVHEEEKKKLDAERTQLENQTIPEAQQTTPELDLDLELEPSGSGQFLSADDLKKDQDEGGDDLSVQLEINAQMNPLDLGSLLQELRALQDAFREEKNEPEQD